MFKKIVLGTLIVGGTSAAVAGTSAYSYFRTGVQAIRDEIRDQIPVEIEIRRARDMIQNLTPEISKNLHRIAREEVEVERLMQDVSEKREKLEKSKKAIYRLKADLETKSPEIVYAGRTYTSSQVREDLKCRFKQYQTQESTVTKLDQVLAARERNLVASRQKLDEMLNAKRLLEVEIEDLQARLTKVQVAETTNRVIVSDSNLGKTRELIDEIATRIDVAEKLVESEGEMPVAIVLDDHEHQDILLAVESYFNVNKKSEALVSTIDEKESHQDSEAVMVNQTASIE
jgi:hypothetical protein